MRCDHGGHEHGVQGIEMSGAMLFAMDDFVVDFLSPSPDTEDKIGEMNGSRIADMVIVFGLYGIELFGGLGGAHVAKDVI